jgi:hypothetical protein
MSKSLTSLYTREELETMLREARTAQHRLATTGSVQEVRTIDRLTRFHPVDSEKLANWIKELEVALGFTTRARSRPVYF